MLTVDTLYRDTSHTITTNRIFADLEEFKISYTIEDSVVNLSIPQWFDKMKERRWLIELQEVFNKPIRIRMADSSLSYSPRGILELVEAPDTAYFTNKVSCHLADGEEKQLTQAELFALLHETVGGTEPLDLSEVTWETVQFAFDVFVNGDYTSDRHLRLIPFLKHVKTPYVQRQDLIIIASDRFQLPETQFRKEMEELLSFFSKSNQVLVKVDQGMDCLLSREAFEYFLNRGLQAFTTPWAISCFEGDVKLSLDVAYQFRTWFEAKQKFQGDNLLQTLDYSSDPNLSFDIVQSALGLLGNSPKYSFTNWIDFSNIFSALQYLGQIPSELNQIAHRMQIVFTEEQLQEMTWNELGTFLAIMKEEESPHAFFWADRECYRISWIEENFERLRGFDSPAILTASFTFFQITPSALDQASFTTLEGVVSDVPSAESAKKELQKAEYARFGDKRNWSARKVYWTEVNNQLVLYPGVEWIMLDGSPILWQRGEVEYMVQWGYRYDTLEELFIHRLSC